MLRVAREVRCVFSGRLKVSNVMDSVIVAGNSFQMVGVEKLVVEGSHLTMHWTIRLTD